MERRIKMELKKRIEQAIVNIPDFPKKGILYRDIMSIFLNAELCQEITESLAQEFKNQIDVICGIESRGFLFAMTIAQKLKIPFVLIRKAGKLPPPILSCEYELEYGKEVIEMKQGFITQGQRVLIHDDVLATGGTSEAAAELVKKSGGIIKGFCFIARLSELQGKEKLEKYNQKIVTLIDY